MVQKLWLNSRQLKEAGFEISPDQLNNLLQQSRERIEHAPDVTHLLTEEARLTKQLYKLAVNALSYGEFTRTKRGGGTDPANRFLDHGNYLAYGLGATATWVLGIPHGLAVLHGKTRRGGLVFDAADLVKDAVILPQAFVSAARGDEEQEFRRNCIEAFTRSGDRTWHTDHHGGVDFASQAAEENGSQEHGSGMPLDTRKGPQRADVDSREHRTLQ